MPLGRPLFKIGDVVEQEDGGPLMTVGIVDEYGTFFDHSQPHYDCWIDEAETGRRALVKHIPEDTLRRVD